MKKFRFDKRYVKTSLYALVVIILAIAFEKILDNFVVVRNFLNSMIGILSPFFVGFFLAYMLNPLVRFFEIKVLGKIKKLDNKFGLKRLLSLVITYLASFTLIIWFISFLIPEIKENIMLLFKNVPDYVKYLQANVLEFLDAHSETLTMGSDDYSIMFEEVFDKLSSWIMDKSASLTSTLNSTLTYFITGTMSIASKILDLVLGIIISIYILADKEKFARQAKKFLYALTSKDFADKIMAIVNDSNDTFESFLIGKVIDSSIIGIICFVGLTLLKIPYSLLISLIVGITNMIPYFGPFIGAVPAIIITLAATVAQKGILPSVWVLIFILVLQQFDGNILGPKILGDSTGLSPFWIIFSITIGGALAGVLGMFIGVPIFAVIYTMFSRFINRKYTEKTILNLNNEEGN